MVVGADGLHSLVASRLGLARIGRWPRRVAFVAHYTGVDWDGGQGEMHVHRDGYVGLADVGDGLTNVALVVPARRVRGLRAGGRSPIDEWISGRPHVQARLAGAVPATTVQATGPFARRTVQPHSRGAVLVGDAAEFFDPFTGEGIYSALRGAVLAVPYIYSAVRATSDRAADAALNAYAERRRNEFGPRWMIERIIGAVIGCGPLIDRVANRLAREPDMADLLVGAIGAYVPSHEVLRAGFIARLLLPAGRAHASLPEML